MQFRIHRLISGEIHMFEGFFLKQGSWGNIHLMNRKKLRIIVKLQLKYLKRRGILQRRDQI